MKDQRGFTLIELLVALGIVAVLVTVLYETFNSVLRSTQQTDEESELDQMARVGMEIIVNEMRSAYWHKPGNQSVASPTEFVGTDDRSATGASDTLRFTAFSHARYQEGVADPSLAILEYELVPVPETETAVLMHSEEIIPFSRTERFELAERVLGLNFRYYDGKEWSDEWSAANMSKLPKAVEIELVFKDYAGRERRYITQTNIPLGA